MIKKEALAIVFGIRKFHQYLFGRHFSLLTDHMPLTLLLGPKRGIPVLAASCLQHWAIQLSAYQYDKEYQASRDHANADALSRLPRKVVEEQDDWSIEADQVNLVQMEQAPITVSQIHEATCGDPVLSRAMYSILHGWPAENDIPEELKIYFNKQDEFTVEDGCINPLWYQSSDSSKISSCCFVGVVFESSWNGPHEIPSQTACVVAQS